MTNRFGASGVVNTTKKRKDDMKNMDFLSKSILGIIQEPLIKTWERRKIG